MLADGSVEAREAIEFDDVRGRSHPSQHHRAEEMEAQCIASGADVYVAKDTGGKQLAASLRALLDSDSGSANGSAVAASGSLTKRQLELVNLLNEGATNRDMAGRLGISEDTVKVHMWRLFKRLGVNSRTQALHYARPNDLLAGSGDQKAPRTRTTAPVGDASIPDLPRPPFSPHPRS